MNLALGNKVDVEDPWKSEEGEEDGKRRCCCKPKTKLQKCLCIFIAVLVLYIVCLTIRLSTANKGSECEPVDDAPTVEEWDAKGLPQVEFATCSNDTETAPLSMLRIHGAHNSYKKKPVARAFALGLNTLVSEWDYEHPTLSKQLEEGMRHFEIDIHYGFEKSRLMAFHLSALDDQTSCYCLLDCLNEVKKWSDANPNHLPINVQFEIKLGSFFDSLRATLNPPKAQELLYIDAAIRKVWKDQRSSVFTPDDLLRGSGTDSLAQAVETRGWPTINSMRGKIYFGIYTSDSWDLGEYTAGGEKSALQTRQMFVFQGPHDPDQTPEKHVALIKVDNVKDQVDLVQNLVRKGYIVRSRGNGINEELADYQVLAEDTFQAGSQLVSLDSDIGETWSTLFNSSGLVGICSESFSPFFCGENITIPCPSSLLS